MDTKYEITCATEYPQLNCDIHNDLWDSYLENELRKFRNSLANEFGGFTEIDHIGGYIMKDTNLVIEFATTFVIIASADKLSNIEDSAKILKSRLYQESVLLTATKLDQCKFI